MGDGVRPGWAVVSELGLLSFAVCVASEVRMVLYLVRSALELYGVKVHG